MAAINRNELIKKLLAKAMECKTAEELIAMAKTEGVTLTKEEADACMAKIEDIELGGATLSKMAGGTYRPPKITQ